MGLMALGIDTIGEIGQGEMEAEIRRHLAAAARDCEERPHLPKPRTVTVQFVLIPVVDAKGFDRVDAQVFTTPKLPPNHTKPIACKVRAGGMLVFNPDSLDNPDQSTIMDQEKP